MDTIQHTKFFEDLKDLSSFKMVYDDLSKMLNSHITLLEEKLDALKQFVLTFNNLTQTLKQKYNLLVEIEKIKNKHDASIPSEFTAIEKGKPKNEELNKLLQQYDHIEQHIEDYKRAINLLYDKIDTYNKSDFVKTNKEKAQSKMIWEMWNNLIDEKENELYDLLQ